MPTPEARKERRERETNEIEASQRELRESIAKTQRLLEASNQALKRSRGGGDSDSGSAAY